MSSSNPRALVLLSSCLMLGLALPACGKSGSQNKASQRKVTVKIGGASAPGAVTANIAEFDPHADIAFDLDRYGSERPDEYAIQQAFFAAFDGIGACVDAEKQRRKTEEQLQGDVSMAIKLNPEKPRPFGVNAILPEGFEKSTKLKDCMREEVAKVQFPKYDGPPVVVEFEFELDPGWEWVDE
ncbi:MAG: hypothetical protein R6X02_24615 [Enhygromyxa sp.]